MARGGAADRRGGGRRRAAAGGDGHWGDEMARDVSLPADDVQRQWNALQLHHAHRARADGLADARSTARLPNEGSAR